MGVTLGNTSLPGSGGGGGGSSTVAPAATFPVSKVGTWTATITGEATVYQGTSPWAVSQTGNWTATVTVSNIPAVTVNSGTIGSLTSGTVSISNIPAVTVNSGTISNVSAGTLDHVTVYQPTAASLNAQVRRRGCRRRY